MTNSKFNEDILIFAFRYALKRQTYAPLTVANEMVRNWKNIEDITKLLILKEIKQAWDDMCDTNKNVWYVIVQDIIDDNVIKNVVTRSQFLTKEAYDDEIKRLTDTYYIDYEKSK